MSCAFARTPYAAPCGWRAMLPYRSGDRMLKMVRREAMPELALPEVLQAINRGEGLLDPDAPVLRGLAVCGLAVALVLFTAWRWLASGYRMKP